VVVVCKKYHANCILSQPGANRDSRAMEFLSDFCKTPDPVSFAKRGDGI